MMCKEYIAASDIDSKLDQIAHLIAELNNDDTETSRFFALITTRNDDFFDTQTEAVLRGFFRELGTDYEQIDRSDIDELIVSVLEDYQHECTRAVDDFDNSKFETILRLCDECYVGSITYDTLTCETVH